MRIAGFEFDQLDGESVLEHARRLEGRTIAEIIGLLERKGLFTPVGKGHIGQVVQTWFGVNRYDATKGPDLPSTRFHGSDKVGLEIKVVPMRRVARNEELRTKERNVVGNINYLSLPFEDWTTATVRHKLEHVLFIFYLYDAANWLNARVLRVHHWSLATEPKHKRIELDWEHTKAIVTAGRADELSERDPETDILRTCRHGLGGTKEKKVPQFSSLVPAWRRAFALKPGHLDLIWIRDVEVEPVVTLREKANEWRETLGEPPPSDAARSLVAFKFVQSKLRELEGMRLMDLDPKWDWSRPQKSAAALVLRKALGNRFAANHIEEFVEEQLTIRVLPVAETTYSPLEAVSFPTMRLKEFAAEEWETSTLQQLVNLILFIPTIIRSRGENQGKRLIGPAFFWSPSDFELDGIRREWTAYQTQVRSGKCKTSRVGGRNVSGLMKESETYYIHMRPHGRDGRDMDIDPFGNRIVKQCFWLNKSFVKTLLDHARDER